MTVQSERAGAAPNVGAPVERPTRITQRLAATGGVLGALAASSCCILPLVLFSVGMGGAWMTNLTSLAPYQPYAIAVTVVLLGWGFYLVYWKPKKACADGAACARPLPNRMMKIMLWLGAAIVAMAAVYPYVAPILLGVPF